MQKPAMIFDKALAVKRLYNIYLEMAESREREDWALVVTGWNIFYASPEGESAHCRISPC
jgi:hypothetical protein